MHFEHLQKGQTKLVKSWLRQDYVAKFWYGNGLKTTLASIDRFVNGEEPLFTLWLAYEGSEPFGFLMTSSVDLQKEQLFAPYCEEDAKAITLDLLIGNPNYLGLGLAHLMIQQFLVQKFPDTTDVFIDPGIENSKAIHVYRKAGFQDIEEFLPEYDPSSPSLLMQLKMRDLSDGKRSVLHTFEE